MKPLAQCLDITDSQYAVIVPSIKAKNGVQQLQPSKSGCTSSSTSASPQPQLPACTPPFMKELTVLPSPPSRTELSASCRFQGSYSWDPDSSYCC